MTRHAGFCWVAGLTAMLCLASNRLPAQAAGTPAAPAYEIAGLREDIRLLNQRMNELTLRLEQLERENSDLRNKSGQNYVTLAQLNEAVADMQRTLQAAMREQKHDILKQVSQQMEKLASETQSALNALAKNGAGRPTVSTPNFSSDYPKEGTTYTVQKGDTLSSIAHKTGARMQDIVNANKISDPTRIQVGQTLFIPQNK